MNIARRTVLGAGLSAWAGFQKSHIMGAETVSPGHVVLLGDSIFDNGVYVRPQPAVIDQLRKALPDGWKATLLAVDGNIAADVPTQLKRLPRDATHLIVSVGGNNALQAAGIFEQPVKVAAEAFLAIARIRRQFDAEYRTMLQAVLRQGKPTAVCTIYDPNFANEAQQQMGICGLAVFNDCITRAAAEHGLPVLDLRVLFTGPDDYSNSIEPSSAGGAKLVGEIRRIVACHDFSVKRSTFYVGA